MKRAAFAACLWSVWLVGVIPAARAGGVVSLNLCADQLLVLLAPERVAALEPMARDHALSFVANQARAICRACARMRKRCCVCIPTWCWRGDTVRRPPSRLLRARGVRVEQIEEPQDFAAIAAQVRKVAALLGTPARGAALVADMQARLAALPHEQRGTALFWEAGGWSAGPGSLADTVLRVAGWRDGGTGGRMGVERILADPPDLLVTDTVSAYPSMATNLAWHPALRGLARRSVDPALMICGGPFTVAAAEALAR